MEDPEVELGLGTSQEGETHEHQEEGSTEEEGAKETDGMPEEANNLAEDPGLKKTSKGKGKVVKGKQGLAIRRSSRLASGKGKLAASTVEVTGRMGKRNRANDKKGDNEGNKSKDLEAIRIETRARRGRGKRADRE